jgi:hypothetical protein
MFSNLVSLFFYECGCCERRMVEGKYVAGAFYCYECARGEHRHAGWGQKAA